MGYLEIKLMTMECEGAGKIYDGENRCIQGFVCEREGQETTLRI